MTERPGSADNAFIDTYDLSCDNCGQYLKYHGEPYSGACARFAFSGAGAGILVSRINTLADFLAEKFPDFEEYRRTRGSK